MIPSGGITGEPLRKISGMDDYLSKPTNLDALNKMMRKWLPAAIALRRSSDSARAAEAPQAHMHTSKFDEPVPIDVKGLSDVMHAADDAFAREMLTLFQSSEAGSAKEIRDLIVARDASALARAAHAAKGAARSAFATHLADLCGDLEKSAQLKDWSGIGTLGSKIDAEFGRVMSFIDDFLKRPQ